MTLVRIGWSWYEFRLDSARSGEHPGVEPVKSRDTLWKLKITSIIFWSEKKGWTMGIHLHRGSTYSEEDRWNWAIIATKDSQNQGARVRVMDLGFGWCHASGHHRMVRKTANRVTTTTATTAEFFTNKFEVRSVKIVSRPCTYMSFKRAFRWTPAIVFTPMKDSCNFPASIDIHGGPHKRMQRDNCGSA
jgi:hypothetical protein